MKSNYDFSKAKRTDHAKRYATGHAVVVEKADGSKTTKHFSLKDGAVLLDPDIRAVFKTSAAVNQALRCLIPLMKPNKTKSTK